jgi:hypothetical protein
MISVTRKDKVMKSDNNGYDFSSAKLKIGRAKALHNELNSYHEYIHKKQCEALDEAYSEYLPLSLSVGNAEPFFSEAQLIIADIATNLQASADHLIYEFWSRNTRKRGKSPYFPMFSSEDKMRENIDTHLTFLPMEMRNYLLEFDRDQLNVL